MSGVIFRPQLSGRPLTLHYSSEMGRTFSLWHWSRGGPLARPLAPGAGMCPSQTSCRSPTSLHHMSSHQIPTTDKKYAHWDSVPRNLGFISPLSVDGIHCCRDAPIAAAVTVFIRHVLRDDRAFRKCVFSPNRISTDCHYDLKELLSTEMFRWNYVRPFEVQHSYRH